MFQSARAPLTYLSAYFAHIFRTKAHILYYNEKNGLSITLFFSYRAKNNDELTFPDMAVVNLVETSYDGWPVVEYNGKQGKVPAVLLEPYKKQEFLKQDK